MMPMIGQSSPINSEMFIGNIGTVAVTQSIPFAANQQVGNTVVSARSRDGVARSIVVTLMDADPTLQAFKLASLRWGGGGVSNLSASIDIGHSRTFCVYASDIQIDVGHYATPAIAGGVRLGAFITAGYVNHTVEGFQAPYRPASGANVIVPIQNFCNSILFVPEADSMWTIVFRRVDGTMVNQIKLSANSLPPPVPLVGPVSDMLITNTSVAQRSLMVHQQLQM